MFLLVPVFFTIRAPARAVFFFGGRFLAVSRFTGVTSFLLNAGSCKLIQSELPPIEGTSLCNGVYCIQACSQVPGAEKGSDSPMS